MPIFFGAKMSFRATRWALAQDTGQSTAKLVLALLADYADDTEFTAYPCQATLARRAHCSRRQIVRILKQLEARGLLRRVKSRQRASDLYILNLQPNAACPRKEKTHYFVDNKRQSVASSIAAATLAIMGG